MTKPQLTETPEEWANKIFADCSCWSADKSGPCRPIGKIIAELASLRSHRDELREACKVLLRKVEAARRDTGSWNDKEAWVLSARAALEPKA